MLPEPELSTPTLVPAPFPSEVPTAADDRNSSASGGHALQSGRGELAPANFAQQPGMLAVVPEPGGGGLSHWLADGRTSGQPDFLSAHGGPLLFVGMGIISVLVAVMSYLLVSGQPLPWSGGRASNAAVAGITQGVDGVAAGVVQTRNGFAWAGEPFVLPVEVVGVSSETLAFLGLSGLPPGTRLSHGEEIKSGHWLVPVSALKDLTVVVPPDFDGTLQVSAALIAADAHTAIRQAPPFALIIKSRHPSRSGGGGPGGSTAGSALRNGAGNSADGDDSAVDASIAERG